MYSNAQKSCLRRSTRIRKRTKLNDDITDNEIAPQSPIKRRKLSKNNVKNSTNFNGKNKGKYYMTRVHSKYIQIWPYNLAFITVILCYDNTMRLMNSTAITRYNLSRIVLR